MADGGDDPAGTRHAGRAPLSLTLEGVTVTGGGRPLLDGLSLRLMPGRRTAIMGPNGAGKSVTLRLIKGLVRPDSGCIRWTGLDAGAARRSVGLVFQQPVHLRRSAAGCLGHALAVAGVPRRERAARVAALLRLAGLEAQAATPARSLSGGEQQRLALARALAAEPRLLLLDEPTASLDPEATAAVEQLMLRAHERGVRVVLVTHNAGQARRVADEVIFIHRGRVTEHTPAAQFFDRPASAEARAYLGGQLLV